MEFIVYLAVAMGLGMITKQMGENKGYENQFWWGFALGLLGVIIVALKKNKTV